MQAARTNPRKASPKRQRLPWLLVAAGVLLAGAASVRFVILRQPSNLVDQETPGPALVSPTRHEPVDDPAKDGWNSERLSQLAQQQLKDLGKLISHPAAFSESAAMRFVTKDFECRKLRPESIEIAFDSDTIRVERAAAGPSSQSQFRGPDGFASAIRDMGQTYQGAEQIRAWLKIYRIQLLENSFETRQFASFTAATGNARIEENAIWHSRWTMENPPRLVSLRVEDYERVVAASPKPLLADCTESVLGNSLSTDDRIVRGIPELWSKVSKHFGVGLYGHHGLSLGDVNGDGLDDLYVCHPSRVPNQLLVQNADGTVTDRAAEAGVDWLNPTSSSLIVDLDNDGDQDLLIGIIGLVAVMENDGTGKFALVAKLHSKSSGLGVHSLAAADYDLDGDLDLYVTYSSNDIPLPVHDANNGSPNVLWRNDGAGKFENVTEQSGLDENNRRFSFAACWEDYDNDGDPDLYVANDFGRNNFYENSKGHFRDVAALRGVEDIAAGMSVSFGDYNLDGNLDLYVSNMFSSAGNRIAFQRKFNPAAGDQSRSVFQRHARGNSLFKGLPDGTFEDVSVPMAVTMGRWSWCSLFVDVNNDRYEDLCVVNGFLTNAKKHDL